MSTYIIVLSLFAVCMALPPSYTSPKLQQPTPLEPKSAPIQDDLEWFLEHGFGSRQENMEHHHFDNNQNQENRQQQLPESSIPMKKNNQADKNNVQPQQLRNNPEPIKRQENEKIVMNLDNIQNQDSQQELNEQLILKKQEQQLKEGEQMHYQRPPQKELKKQQPNGQIQKIQPQKQQQWMGKEQEEQKQNQRNISWMSSTKVLTSDDMAEIKPKDKKIDQEIQGMKSVTLLEDSKESDEREFDFNRHHGMKVQNQMKQRNQRESMENDSHALMNTIYKN